MEHDTVSMSDIVCFSTVPYFETPDFILPYGLYTVPYSGYLSGAGHRGVPGSGMYSVSEAVSLQLARADNVIYGFGTSRYASLGGTYRINGKHYVRGGVAGYFLNGGVNFFSPVCFTALGYTPGENVKFEIWGNYVPRAVLGPENPNNNLFMNTGVGASAEFNAGGKFRIGISAGVNRL